MKLYLLQHAYEYGENLGHTEIKTLGIYESKALAVLAVENYKHLPGFCEYGEDCFHIDEYELNENNWIEGFVAV